MSFQKPPRKANEPHSVTLPGRANKRELHALKVQKNGEVVAEYDRPKTRADCLPGGINAQRPCPWASCRHNLYAGINEGSGSVVIAFPDLEIWDLPTSCSLDVADRRKTGLSRTVIAGMMNMSVENIRLIEKAAKRKLRGALRDELVPISKKPGRNG